MSKKSDGLPSGLESAGLNDPTSKGQEQKDPKGELKPRSVTSKRQLQIVCRIAYVNDVIKKTNGVVLRFPVVRGRGKCIKKKANYGSTVHLIGKDDNKNFILVNVPSLDSVLLKEATGNGNFFTYPYEKIKELNPLSDLPEYVHWTGGNGKYKVDSILSNDAIYLIDEEGKTVRAKWHEIVECPLRR